MHYITNHIPQLYRLQHYPTAITSRVEYPLRDDSCMFPSNGYEMGIRPSRNQDFQSQQTMTWMQPLSFQFLESQIADYIYRKYFNSKRKVGMLHLTFINLVNGTMVCLTFAILCYQLRAY